MNSNDLFDIIGETPEKYVRDAATAKMISMQKRPYKKFYLIAAIVALMLFLMGSAIVYILSLEDMAFGNKVQEYYDGSSQEVTLLSLQGIQGTPGYEATKEWYDWLETYDVDGTIWDSHEAYGVDFGEEYYAYGLYSQEMKEKLDEICQKYDLELLGRMRVDPDIEAGCNALQIQGIFRPGIQAESDFENICYYPTGSFEVEGYVQLQGYDRHIVSFKCHRKDAFTELYALLGTEGTYEEWTYTTSYGVNILMVIDKGGVRDHAFMMVDSEQYTYYFSIYEFDDMPLPDKEELEAYAEAFDFAVEPQRVSEEELQESDDRRETADQKPWEETYYQGFRLSLTTADWCPPEKYSDSFDSYVPYILEHASAEYHYYTLVDLDGDGTEEFLWGTQDGYIYEVAFMKNGEVTLRFDDYLCEGNILFSELGHDSYKCNGETFEANRCTSYQYSTLTETIVKIYYLPTANRWIETRPGQPDRDITEAEAKQIMNQYIIMKLDMRPLSDYS